MNARAVAIVLSAAVAAAAAGAGYYFLIKGKKAEVESATPDPASFEGEVVGDALAVENPPPEIAGEGQETGDTLGVEGDPWLDPDGVEGEEITGSGDYVEGEEPFEDVYAAPPEGGRVRVLLFRRGQWRER